MLPLCRGLALARYAGRVDSRPEIGVFELLTTTSITSETGNARRFVRGDDPGLASDPVLLGDKEKNLNPSAFAFHRDGRPTSKQLLQRLRAD
jgi:hypothetical protein